MGEIKEAYGKGKMYEIDGQEYEALPCPNIDMEDAMDMYGRIITTKFSLNYMKFKDEDPKERKERVKAINWLLDKAFRGKVGKDVLGKIDRNTTDEMINFIMDD